MNNVSQKKEAIQYPRFIKLIIDDLIKKFPKIHQKIEEDYHSIKDDIPWVSVYTTGDVRVRGMLISGTFLTEEIRATNDIKGYEMVIMKVDVLKNQPQLVVSTQGTHRMCRRQGYMIQNMERKCVTTKQLWKTHKQVNQVLHLGVSQLAKKDTEELIKTNLKPCITETIIKDRDAFCSEVPDLVSQKFNAQAPKIIEDHVQSNVIKVEETVIDEDKVIPKDETPKLIIELQDVNKRVPTIFDYERIRATLNDALSNQFMNTEEQEDIRRPVPKPLVFVGPQRNLNEPPRIHAERFPKVDLEENMNHEKQAMYLTKIVKVCDAPLEKILKEVKLKIFQSEPWRKPPLLSELDRDILRAFEIEKTKRLSHQEQMRRWKSFVNGRPILPTMKGL
nr:hypothetical protein [Tanacetum cinerariifolium]